MKSYSELKGLSFLETDRAMPLMRLPIRSTIVQLENARVLISPCSTHTASDLAAAGDVTDVVAPSLLHADGMRAAAEAHPRARLWGPRNVDKKVGGLKWHGIFGVDVWPYELELQHHVLEGMPSIEETIFFHDATRTLIVSDLAFNIDDAKGFGAWLILSMFGTYRKFGVSRLFVSRVQDREKFEKSLERAQTLEFENIVPGHGSVLLGDAKAKLKKSLQARGY